MVSPRPVNFRFDGSSLLLTLVRGPPELPALVRRRGPLARLGGDVQLRLELADLCPQLLVLGLQPRLLLAELLLALLQVLEQDVLVVGEQLRPQVG